MQEDKILIKLSGADIMNGENTVLFDVNLEVDRGDFIYLTGKVGTGKTSIIRTITAENTIKNGAANVCGYDLKTLKGRDIPHLRRKMGVIFQDFQLLQDRTVEKNLQFVLRSTGWKDKREIENRVEEVLDAVGLKHKKYKMPHQLSGGEQQRIAIARALLNRPDVILADEPTGNLDEETADGIMQLLSEINREGTAILMVTHNLTICENYPGIIYECRDETVALRPGHGGTETTPEETVYE